jgi:predicted transport protein
VNPDEIELEPGFSRDVRNIGHYGTGDLEISIYSVEDFEKAKRLINMSVKKSPVIILLGDFFRFFDYLCS